jgi:hypothetical protein
MRTEACTAMPDGSARECAHCPDEIEIGTPAVTNAAGVWVHPECADFQGGGMHAPNPARRPGTASKTTTRDLGDQIWEAFEAQSGKTVAPPAAAAPASAKSTSSASGGDFGDKVWEAFAKQTGRKAS